MDTKTTKKPKQIEKKYTLDKSDSKVVDGTTVYRIVALKNVRKGVPKGARGGYGSTGK